KRSRARPRCVAPPPTPWRGGSLRRSEPYHPATGPSNTQGALISLQRRPATKVVVLQWPQGALQISRGPLRQRPRVRTIFVLVPVSSMKTSFLASRLDCSAFHFRRASATSAGLALRRAAFF